MGVSFDYAPNRPEHIDVILNGLDRYNPETTAIFQEYVLEQCDNRTIDTYANLALLKLYQFNPHLSKDETITNILVKFLTVFPSPDFSLALHLLPPHILIPTSDSKPLFNASDAMLSEAVRKLNTLNNLLSEASYSEFWTTFDRDDLYADLVADVSGFEELIRIRIALTVSHSVQEIERSILESWLGVQGAAFETFVTGVCGWQITGNLVQVPLNKENEAKGTTVRENVKFEQFSRVIRRAFEQSLENSHSPNNE
ncbi:Eukaryotic translation initiation factor 3 subunit K [Golovinomyces cichoracearum]|uniref:Eukaryotic translation initiation factor 3 subunit K n=1 Tax=Golovinomyces cichoracearum TaxID=62708 RepID=A0A420IFZ2_9PEZI|nr:Eukaryotic translation initiation factor 3 subunit K [Golovinomyces cichoracearum]